VHKYHFGKCQRHLKPGAIFPTISANLNFLVSLSASWQPGSKRPVSYAVGKPMKFSKRK
jgi:hypothetical protein